MTGHNKIKASGYELVGQTFSILRLEMYANLLITIKLSSLIQLCCRCNRLDTVRFCVLPDYLKTTGLMQEIIFA